MLENNLLYSKKKVAIYGTENDRLVHYTATTAAVGNRTDKNLTDRITKFQEQLKNEYFYGISLKFLYEVGLVNQFFKLKKKYILMLETDMQKLFETNINQSTDTLPTSVDADVIFAGAPYFMYEQFQLDDNFKTCFKGTMQSKYVLRMRIKPTPYQKSFELVHGTESGVVDFTGANKQFSFFTISLVHNKSEQHRSIYNSYNVELASTKVKSITLENASNTICTFNSIKFDTDDSHDKFSLYNQFVVWYCKDSSIALLSDYANNPLFQELPTLSEYFTSADKKIFINLRRRKGYMNEIEKLNRDDSNLTITIKLKVEATKKMRLRVTGYYQGQHLCSMSRAGLIMNYIEFGVNK